MAEQTPPYRVAGDRTAEPAGEPRDYHVGAELRDARERMGVDLKTAAAALNIRYDYLTGLEQNDHTALPALPYAIGFVRSYAAYVGLDPAKLSRRFREESGGSPGELDYIWLKPIDQGRFSGTALLLLSLAIAGAAYSGWYFHTADVRRPAAAADIARIQRISPGAVAAADTIGGTARTVRTGTAGISGSTPPERSPEDGGAKRQDRETAALPEGPDAEPGAGPNAGPDDRPDVADENRTPDPEPEPAAAGRPVVLKARGLVWIRVRDPQTRRVIVEGIMKEGNEVTVPDNPGLVLDVGRANQLEYLIGGKSAGLAGPSAAVRHNLSLDPARLAPSAGPAVAQETPEPGSGGEGAAAANAEGGTSNAESGTSEALPAAAEGAIVLKALGLVWIRVRHPQTRQVVVEGIMKKGNEVTVPDNPGLVLDVGRANQLEYLIGGKPAGIAGDSPGPIHNLSLDPVRLKRGG